MCLLPKFSVIENILFTFIILGDRSCLKENAVPSVFEFRDCVADESPRAKRYKSREDSAVNQPVQLESLDFQYETEVSSTDEITKLPIPENYQDACDVDIQCEILVPVS